MMRNNNDGFVCLFRQRDNVGSLRSGCFLFRRKHWIHEKRKRQHRHPNEPLLSGAHVRVNVESGKGMTSNARKKGLETGPRVSTRPLQSRVVKMSESFVLSERVS